MERCEELRLEEHVEATIVRLDRPAKRNALTSRLVTELHHALEQVAASSAPALIVTGEGSAFCAGMDLEELRGLAGASAERNRGTTEQLGALFRALYEYPLPTIAAVNGAALAGGCGLATLCDFVLAAPAAKFGYTEVRVGFLPAMVSAFLLRQVGERTATDLLLTGRMLEAGEARELGLVNAVVPAAELLPRALRLAAELAANSPAALRATKRLLRELAGHGLDEQMRRAIDASLAIRGGEEFQEGLNAFLEKRPPHWPHWPR